MEKKNVTYQELVDIEKSLEKPTRKMQLLGFNTEEELNLKYICRNPCITTENFFPRICKLYDLKMANLAEFEYDTGCDIPS